MHHKYVVIDDKLVATGSFNWTQAAVLKNNENLLLIRDEGLAKKYSDNFEELWEKFKSTELTLSQISDKQKEKAEILKKKLKANEYAKNKKIDEQKPKKIRKKDSDYIESPELDAKQEQDDNSEKVKKQRQHPVYNDSHLIEEEESISSIEENKTNENDPNIDLNDTDSSKEQSMKIKKIFKLKNSLERNRKIIEIKAKHKRSLTLNSYVQNALSFTLGAVVSIGSYLLMNNPFSN